MSLDSSIKYLRQDQIDKKKWDECIAKSDNGLIYAYASYLDAMADNWDAIIINDYEVVMPLPWRRKYFIKYVYQPPFIQQLGVFYRGFLSENIYTSIFQCIKKRFGYCSFFINYANAEMLPIVRKNILHNNYVLNIEGDYKAVASNYKKNVRKNIKKANTQGLVYKTSNDVASTIRLYKNSQQKNFPHATDFYFERVKQLAEKFLSSNQAIVRSVFDSKGNLLSTVLLFNDQKRLYNLFSYTSFQGRNLESNFFLYNSLIKEFSGKGLTLDFEGSDIPSIEYFYRSFGAINIPYYRVEFINIFFLRLFK